MFGDDVEVYVVLFVLIYSVSWLLLSIGIVRLVIVVDLWVWRLFFCVVYRIVVLCRISVVMGLFVVLMVSENDVIFLLLGMVYMFVVGM